MGGTPVLALRRRLTISILVLTVLVGPTGCSSRARVVVGSKNFTEQFLVGEIIAQQIERRLGTEVDRKLNLGGTLLTQRALERGSIDLYPEYTGTALTAVLHHPAVKDPAQALEEVRKGYRRWNLEWLPPLGFNNTFSMVIRTDAARMSNLKTLSDAARRPEPWRMGIGYEFAQRPDGLSGLLQTYSLRLNGDPVAMDLGLLYPALRSRSVDIAAANATDGALARPEFVVLEDDRHYFPPYECAIVVRQDTLGRFPGLREALLELSNRIPESEMRRLNARVDVDHQSAVKVAAEFLNSWR